jgi:hypothetical protein
MHGLLRASGLALLLTLFFAGPCAGPPGIDEPPCEVGAERSSPGAPGREREIVLGCGRTPDGTVVQLSSSLDAGGPCLSITGLPGGTRACGRAPSERVPPAREAIGGGAIVRRTTGAQLELYGETAATVRRVLLRYRLPSGGPGERPATLIRARDPVALTAARIGEPFGYFVGAVPPRAVRVSAVALDRSGRVLGRLGFDRLARDMPPTVFIAVDE